MFVIVIDVEFFFMLMHLIIHNDTKLIIPFEDKYVCSLQTHLRIVLFLDSLRLIFNYELCFFFQLSDTYSVR